VSRGLVLVQPVVFRDEAAIRWSGHTTEPLHGTSGQLGHGRLVGHVGGHG
jgi:hypothetical protein